MNINEIVLIACQVMDLLIIVLMAVTIFGLRAALSRSETKRVESLVMPEHVDVVVRQSGRRPDGTVDRSDGNGVYMYRTPTAAR